MRLRTILVVGTLAAVLGGCDSFDPLDKFQDWDIMGSSKPPIRGERSCARQPCWPLMTRR